MDYTPALAHLSAADPVLATLIVAVGPCELQPTGHSFAGLADAAVHARGEAWRPHRSVASWYLWRARRMV